MHPEINVHHVTGQRFLIQSIGASSLNKIGCRSTSCRQTIDVHCFLQFPHHQHPCMLAFCSKYAAIVHFTSVTHPFSNIIVDFMLLVAFKRCDCLDCKQGNLFSFFFLVFQTELFTTYPFYAYNSRKHTHIELASQTNSA